VPSILLALVHLGFFLTFSRNNLIAQLTLTQQDELLAQARHIKMKSGDVLPLTVKEDELVYFIVSGAVALFASVMGQALKQGLAVGIVGHEGAIGLQSGLGLGLGKIIPIVQNAGEAFVIKGSILRQLVDSNPKIKYDFSKYLWSMYNCIVFNSCIFHVKDIKTKLAYWVLLTLECCDHGDSVYLKHSTLASMLGVRRTSITLAANELRDLGFMQYSRGHIKVLNKTVVTDLLPVNK